MHSLGVLVAGLELVGDLRRKSAFRWVGFDIFDHLSFGLTVIPDQLAGFVRRRVALARSLDQLAARHRLFAQGDEFLRAGIVLRRHCQTIFEWTGGRIGLPEARGEQRNRQPAQNTLQHLRPPCSAQKQAGDADTLDFAFGASSANLRTTGAAYSAKTKRTNL